jgi:hypothetical protein
MKRIWLVLGLALLWGAGGDVSAQQKREPASPQVSAHLQRAPLRDALDSLFKSTKYDLVVYSTVKNVPISLDIKNAEFDDALKLLIEQAAAVQPGLFYTRQGNTYTVQVRPADQSKPVVPPRLAKIPIEFQNAEEILKQLERLGTARALDALQAVPRDNSLLARGSDEQIRELEAAVRLLDVPTQMLSIRVGVTGPGVHGKPFQLSSVIRTVNGLEVVVDEQTTSEGAMSRLRVQVRPLIQGDGEILTESDWDLSIPVAGGAKGPIRLVKRLTTTARLHSGRGITVGEVDLAPYGGTGTVRLWLRGEILPASFAARVTTRFGEELGFAQLFEGKPYIMAQEFALELGGELRRNAAGGYEIRLGDSKELTILPPAERPTQAGPFRLSRDGQVISQNLVWVADDRVAKRLEPGGDPMIPLDDVARWLGGRLRYDSASDRYVIEGGSRLQSLRFPRRDASNR